ncbi:uncharacterized protein BDW43DRAFT_313585 [Aspergillus alliaceus]|uniref:uncharacterized protein n=1 Tax=Petromyces alliaceus TaxID=209559 RepID=UPI0012A6891A|nr:uncharacterized protein BDW43DRAFT_313585 [Aspergillus alliaceus]KAB8230774.1 hypothetical protein BDW43DRAFT_313585 [Aspergillus alliaceus]
MAFLKPLPILNFTGTWVMEKALSNGIESLMKLQCLNWAIRRAFRHIRITSTITEYASTAADGSPLALHLDVVHTVTGGFTGTTEKRTLDWSPYVHHDYVFGPCSLRSRLIGGIEDRDGHVRPALDMETTDVNGKVYEFLRGAVSSKGEREEGFVVEETPQEYIGSTRGGWLHTVSRSEERGWTMEQVWGFEMIRGDRYHTRRIVVINKSGDYALARVVYKYHSETQQI